MTPAPTAAEPSPAPPTAPAAPARAARPPPSYLQAVAAALERQKRYPEAARARRAAGVAVLQFTVLRNGTIASWRIERRTGDADLDNAVEIMIQRARLPPMPSSMEVDTLVITVPVRFEVR
ncbi:energy transducer TonB [Roseomonas terrae]|uniref:Energy transducer TonB n=1 Tax=Neoroseomonas terrae TaxID=424799 RepID=A0ABS5EN47_9PROT|nr:energy transducer TonB [Neoroseomonas terrae]